MDERPNRNPKRNSKSNSSTTQDLVKFMRNCTFQTWQEVEYRSSALLEQEEGQTPNPRYNEDFCRASRKLLDRLRLWDAQDSSDSIWIKQQSGGSFRQILSTILELGYKKLPVRVSSSVESSNEKIKARSTTEALVSWCQDVQNPGHVQIFTLASFISIRCYEHMLHVFQQQHSHLSSSKINMKVKHLRKNHRKTTSKLRQKINHFSTFWNNSSHAEQHDWIANEIRIHQRIDQCLAQQQDKKHLKEEAGHFTRQEYQAAFAQVIHALVGPHLRYCNSSMDSSGETLYTHTLGSVGTCYAQCIRMIERELRSIMSDRLIASILDSEQAQLTKHSTAVVASRSLKQKKKNRKKNRREKIASMDTRADHQVEPALEEESSVSRLDADLPPENNQEEPIVQNIVNPASTLDANEPLDHQVLQAIESMPMLPSTLQTNMPSDNQMEHIVEEMSMLNASSDLDRKIRPEPQKKKKKIPESGQSIVGDLYEEDHLTLSVNKEQDMQIHTPEKTHEDMPNDHHIFSQLLHHDIVDMTYQLQELTASRRPWQLWCIDRFTNVILGLWPESSVRCFGSFATGLAVPQSDVDLLVSEPPVFLNNMQRLAQVLESQVWCARVQVIDRTVIPIIKVTMKCSRVLTQDMDISFDTPEHRGMETCVYTKRLVSEWPEITPLVVILKQLLIQHQLHEHYSGGLSSYGLTLMVASVVVPLEHILPPDRPTLDKLLVDFLQCFDTKFNAREQQINLHVHGQSSPFEIKSPHFRADALVIVDPIRRDQNAAKGCFGFAQVQQVFAQGWRALTESSSASSSVLGRLFAVDHHVHVLSSLRKVWYVDQDIGYQVWNTEAQVFLKQLEQSQSWGCEFCGATRGSASSILNHSNECPLHRLLCGYYD